jgi:hypothetical protein
MPWNPGAARIFALLPAVMPPAMLAVMLVMMPAMVLAAPPCCGDDSWVSPTDERLRISLGAMYLKSTTSIRLDSSGNAPGTPIDGEGRLGLDRADFEPKFQATVRVAVRHRLSFDYFTLDRSGNTTLAGTPIVFKDVTFIPGDQLQTKLSLRSLGITYGYSFWHSDTLEIAGTFGVHASDVSAMARVQSPTRNVFQSEDEAGPVPTLGLDATWVVSRRFYLDGRVQYLDLHVGNLDGSLGIYEFDALYRYRPNVSVGIGYTDFKVHLESTRNTHGGLFDLSAQGPQMFFRIAF